MKEPLYRQAFSFGWQFTRRHKFLWVYGFFAAALGHMGIFDILTKVSTAVFRANMAIPEVTVFLRLPILHGGRWVDFFSERGVDGVWAIWLVIVLLGILAFFTVVAVVSQGALIHASAQGKSSHDIAQDYREWHAGVSHFWRLFVLHATKKCMIGFFALLAGWSAYTAVLSPTASNLLAFLGIFLVVTILGLILSFFVIYAAGYIVVEEHSFGEAIISAWRLFTSHWLTSLEVGALFLGLNILLALFGTLGFLVLLLPTALFWFIVVIIGSPTLFTVVLMFLLFCFVTFVMLLGSVFTVFSTSVWTYLFMHMHRYGVKSSILHWFSLRG